MVPSSGGKWSHTKESILQASTTRPASTNVQVCKLSSSSTTIIVLRYVGKNYTKSGSTTPASSFCSTLIAPFAFLEGDPNVASDSDFTSSASESSLILCIVCVSRWRWLRERDKGRTYSSPTFPLRFLFPPPPAAPLAPAPFPAARFFLTPRPEPLPFAARFLGVPVGVAVLTPPTLKEPAEPLALVVARILQRRSLMARGVGFSRWSATDVLKVR